GHDEVAVAPVVPHLRVEPGAFGERGALVAGDVHDRVGAGVSASGYRNHEGGIHNALRGTVTAGSQPPAEPGSMIAGDQARPPSAEDAKPMDIKAPQCIHAS